MARVQELFHPVEWNNIKKNMLTLAHIPNEKLEAFLKTQKFDRKKLSKDGIINFFIENLFNNCKDLNSHYIISDSEQHKKNEVVYFNTKYIMVQLSELFKEEYHDELKKYHDNFSQNTDVGENKQDEGEEKEDEKRNKYITNNMKENNGDYY